MNAPYVTVIGNVVDSPRRYKVPALTTPGFACRSSSRVGAVGAF
jgi:hypothetical protein